jgi:hypothetical protein
VCRLKIGQAPGLDSRWDSHGITVSTYFVFYSQKVAAWLNLLHVLSADGEEKAPEGRPMVVDVLEALCRSEKQMWSKQYSQIWGSIQTICILFNSIFSRDPQNMPPIWGTWANLERKSGDIEKTETRGWLHQSRPMSYSLLVLFACTEWGGGGGGGRSVCVCTCVRSLFVY